MKKSVIALTVVVILLSVNMVAIAQVNITLNYTADNEISAFYYILNDYTVIPLSLGPGAAWWPTVDSYSAFLEAYAIHEFVWEVKNWDFHTPSLNPGGFLGEILPADKLLIEKDYASTALSGTTWEVYVSPTGAIAPDQFHTIPWSWSTTYGANSDPTIWNVNLGGPVSGINGSAQWIWGPGNFGDPGAPTSSSSVYIRATVYAHAPEPGTILLLGSGLLGLGIVARMRRKKAKS